MLTSAQIRKIAGSGARPELVNAIVKGWPDAERKARITTKPRAVDFLANIMTETGGLQILSESGAYRAPQIMKIFGVGHHSAAVTADEAQRIAALPVSKRGPVLFERVYGLGNPKKAHELGNTHPGDGWKYRGGGMMQKTGGAAYLKFEQQTGVPIYQHPELLRDPDTAFEAAYMEWAQDNFHCNVLADAGNLQGTRRYINGGLNGWAACKAYAQRANAVLNDSDFLEQAEDVPLPTARPDIPQPASPHSGEPCDDVHPCELFAVPSTDPDDDSHHDDVKPLALLDTSAEPAAEDFYDGNYHVDVEVVQLKLGKLGYAHGMDDGKWGGMLAGAIAGFMNDRHMSGPPNITPELKAELVKAEGEGYTRPISETRAAMPASQIPEAKHSWHNQIVTALGGFGAAVSAFVGSVGDYFESAKAQVEPIKTFFADVPGWTWAVLIFGICVVMFLKSRAATKAATEAFRTGQKQ